MIHLVLFQPEIPPNTGNIIRLCANIGAQLHLIHPLGFRLDDQKLKRAGLDYHEFANIKEYVNFPEFIKQNSSLRLFACSTKGSRNYCDVSFQRNDALIFGPETRGLPEEILSSLPKEQVIRIPMQAHSRSLNLSNSVSIIAYEAMRQLHFEGLSSNSTV